MGINWDNKEWSEIVEEKVLISPASGAKLEKTDDKQIYYDKYARVYVHIDDNGKMLPLISPMSGRKLEINSDGTYSADGHKFILDSRGIIPTYIPDDTLEPAHIDGDYLVGNNTGRRFPIRNDGKVIMPFDPIDISPEASIEELNAYYQARKERQYNETQEWIDNKLIQDAEEDRIAMDAAIEKLTTEKFGDKKTRERTDKFLKIVSDEVDNGWELSDGDYDKLDMIIKDGKLAEDIPDSEIAYNPTYIYLKEIEEKVKNGGYLTAEELEKIRVILETGKLPEEEKEEESSHSRR